MVIEGADYSFGRPDPACLAASGIRFAVRYTSIGRHDGNTAADNATVPRPPPSHPHPTTPQHPCLK